MDVFRCVERHEYAAYGPIDHIDHVVHIARAYGHVGPAMGAGFIELEELRDGVGEVGIHLEAVFVTALKHPAESGDVGCAETLFPGTLNEVERGGELALKAADDGGSAVGRAVVDDEDVELLWQGEYCADYLLDVLLLVVCRYDDD